MAKTTKPTKTKRAKTHHYLTCPHCEANFRLGVSYSRIPAHRWKRTVEHPNGELCPGGAPLPEPTPTPETATPKPTQLEELARRVLDAKGWNDDEQRAFWGLELAEAVIAGLTARAKPAPKRTPAPEPEPRFVWILMGESPTTEDGNGTDWIEAVYATEDAAIRSMYDSIDEAKREGQTIHYDPRLGDDAEQDPDGDWTRDFHVNRHQVIE